MYSTKKTKNLNVSNYRWFYKNTYSAVSSGKGHFSCFLPYVGNSSSLKVYSVNTNIDVNPLLNPMLQVYVAAGTVYNLESELSDLEECARGICSATSDMELSFLEEQVASAAAKVQQSELQVSRSQLRIHFKAEKWHVNKVKSTLFI